jgi:hypothetical protein
VPVSGASTSASSRFGVAAAVLVGVVVAAAIGSYAELHSPALRPLFLVGFSGMLQMKTWLATVAALFVVVQLLTALWMWGRLPGVRSAPAAVTAVHRWSGTLAFVTSLPVAMHCIWSLGFVTTSPRVVLHSTLGCVFYGAYATKMVGVRLRGAPAWLVPVLGGFTLAVFALVWLTSALWFFTRSGVPLT